MQKKTNKISFIIIYKKDKNETLKIISQNLAFTTVYSVSEGLYTICQSSGPKLMFVIVKLLSSTAYRDIKCWYIIHVTRKFQFLFLGPSHN